MRTYPILTKQQIICISVRCLLILIRVSNPHRVGNSLVEIVFGKKWFDYTIFDNDEMKITVQFEKKIQIRIFLCKEHKGSLKEIQGLVRHTFEIVHLKPLFPLFFLVYLVVRPHW